MRVSRLRLRHLWLLALLPVLYVVLFFAVGLAQPFLPNHEKRIYGYATVSTPPTTYGHAPVSTPPTT